MAVDLTAECVRRAIEYGSVLLAGLVVGAARVSLPFDLAAIFRRAAQETGVKQDALAALMGITPPQLSMQLAAQGHLSLSRLLMLLADADGRLFLATFFAGVLRAAHLEESTALASAKADILAALDLVARRPVKASLRDSNERQVS